VNGKNLPKCSFALLLSCDVYMAGRQATFTQKYKHLENVFKFKYILQPHVTRLVSREDPG
jgi:hypothetical protein